MCQVDSNGSDARGSAAFATTHWSAVLAAGTQDSTQTAEALAALCRAYWRPLYAFAMRRGYNQHDAQDMTQEFFARFLARNYVAQADREKGRFRSFLLASLKHFLANEWDRANAVKRGGGCALIPWDELEHEPQASLESHLPPDQIYERQWALTLLDQVFTHLRDECVAAGKAELFDTLRVYLSGEKAAATYAEAGMTLRMSTGAVQVAVSRLRKRYGELLRAEIAHTVSRPEEIDEELRHLFAALRE
jgi:RNA polymerase sigma-70 factor (ECF subfamily)